MSVSVVVQFKALPTSLASFQNIMETVKIDLPTIPGCRGVSVMQDLEDSCRFTLVEVWESQARHAAHVEGLIADGTSASIAAHLDMQPSSGYFRTL
ncbi:antibiotic biosynthesis monooxygenase (plasmid) [Rhizobium sp. 32-5/1]|uniref:putative quinol monooxygenase n=1 Tax=Rhizobium sp. 32-5/1 TaxID=3019602 RepID=UPI00240E64E3|nr:antibiotic biosynthesis monooxygenase family protein [Rhizobium sp. 32-5/1]WEZ85425.1 antibiotic biosynthesis monooxygenase [Rhizobium sp. 32-5/1]